MSFNSAPRLVQDEIAQLDGEISHALTTEPTEIELKAAAFDHLMKILGGHHRRTGGHTRVLREAMPESFDLSATEATTVTTKTETVHHWEWSFRINAAADSPDLRKLLLDEQRDAPDPE